MNRIYTLLILFFFIGGCQNTAPPIQNSTEKRFLKAATIVNIRSLHPRIGLEYPCCTVLSMLFEGLMHLGKDGKPTLGLAKSYEISKDQKTYVFHLRNSKWSNGDPVTAYDFEYAWKTKIDPSLGGLGSNDLYFIKNVREIVKGEKPLNSVGIKVLDAKTIQIELEYPTPYFLELLASVTFFPVHERIDRTKPNWATQIGKDFICNGPFLLKKYQIGNEVIVEKNPSYWDSNSIKLDGIKIAIISDETTQLLMFEKGELDFIGHPIGRLSYESLPHLQQKNKLKILSSLVIQWLFINVKSFPFQSKKMRQAFSLATNRKTITSDFLDNLGIPALGVLPPSIATQKKPFFQDNDQKKALLLFHEALEELGIQRDALSDITLSIPLYQDGRRLAEIFQQQWSSTFNIPIKISIQEWPSYFSKLTKGNFQIGLMAWRSLLRDPIYFLQTFRDQTDRLNMSQWENAEYKKWLSLAEQEIDPVLRAEFYNRAETILMDEMPVIPIYFKTSFYLQNDLLKDVVISEVGQLDFRFAHFDSNTN